MFPVFQGGQTPKFTFVSSIAPDSAPTFSVINSAGTVLASVTAQESDATHYWALFTMPDSAQFLLTRWFATKTLAGSAYQFQKEMFVRVDPVRFPH